LKKTFDLTTPPPPFPEETRNLVGTNDVFSQIGAWARQNQQAWDKLKKMPAGRLVAAAKNTLIAADMAGSALPRDMPNDDHRWEEIEKALTNKPKPSDLQFIVDWRLKRAKRKGEKGELRQFQILVAESTAPVTYLKAGCGGGKTLAAYLWAAQRYPNRRLFFCYPTTGTATEGFKDYLHPADADADENDPDIERLRQIDADLFHSRRDVDFEVILSTGADTKSADADAAAKLEALDAWSTPVVACTVDTVLGLVQNNRRGLLLWPALAQSAFVFDEIHAYDDRLFGALLRFLRDVPGLPVLLMTASLPKVREEALVEVLRKQGQTLNQIPTKEQFERWEKEEPRETLPRYRKEKITDNDPLPIIKETLKSGGKVLWVCNTVGRVMDAADRAAECNPLIYHSRFKYVDRVQRHKAVIGAFDRKGPALAICSQVAEMSLDLSADLLVTDLAPVPPLIQRLGRLNRKAKAGDPTKPLVIIEPDGDLPYKQTELDAARMWLGELTEKDISQQQLAEKWEQSGDQPPELVVSAWLDGGPTTTVSELREASPGITVLMDEDAQPMIRYENRIRQAKKQAAKTHSKLPRSIYKPLPGERLPKDRARRVIPMTPPPKAFNWWEWLRFKGILVAPSGTIKYNPMRGAEWNK
jgi:CRISPR-associated endonuclease/helicase Cas3